jgi:hypothetical protein
MAHRNAHAPVNRVAKELSHDLDAALERDLILGRLRARGSLWWGVAASILARHAGVGAAATLARAAMSKQG